MHTEPTDPEGPNLFSTCEMLGIQDNVFFSRDRLEFEKMNILHNISDVCVNVSYAEGFGLSTLESMSCAKPIMALKTGGLTRQVVDHRDGSENGVALPVEFKSLVGSQQVPYIYEDYCSAETTANGFMKLFDMGHEKRVEIGKKAKAYVDSEFSYQKTIDLWHDSLLKLVEEYDDKKQLWEMKEL